MTTAHQAHAWSSQASGRSSQASGRSSLSSPLPAAPGYDDLHALMSLMTGDEKHSSAATSTLDVIWVVYDRVLDVSPATVSDPGPDRFYLSKGHGPMAYYATLAAKGLFPTSWLADWATYDSPPGQHPDRVLVPGVEISSGSLGHGLPLAVGTAIGLRAQGIDSRVVVLVGDAELDEGSNSEAIQLAGALGLDRLTTVVIDNASTSYHCRESSPHGSATRAGPPRSWTVATTARCSKR
jgi:transketolase